MTKIIISKITNDPGTLLGYFMSNNAWFYTRLEHYLHVPSVANIFSSLLKDNNEAINEGLKNPEQ